MTAGTPIARAARFSYKIGRMAAFRDRPRLGHALFRTAALLDPGHRGARREIDKRSRRAPGDPWSLNEVILGTMGQCNASCIHCPTNKIVTDHVPRTPMPMPIFEKIVHGIADSKLAVTGQIGFGLHGDGLLDPHVVARARLIADVLPDVPIGVTTNAAAFNLKRHGALADTVWSFTIHCESLRPDVYDGLMAPLRAKNVFPKYRQMLDAFPGKIRVSVPVSRRNRDELPAIRDWFMGQGACEVVFDPLASRCVDDATIFDGLALAPQPIRCRSDVLDTLVVDSDGLVLGCCQDFQRIEPVGDLAREGFAETLASLRRHGFGAKLDAGAHETMPTCSKCRGDIRTPQFPFDHA